MSTKTVNPRKALRQLLMDNLHPDSVSTNKAGQVVCRWGFFYTHGRTAEQYVKAVSRLLDQFGIAYLIADSGEVWKPFSGGAPLCRQSHFYVTIQFGA